TAKSPHRSGVDSSGGPLGGESPRTSTGARFGLGCGRFVAILDAAPTTAGTRLASVFQQCFWHAQDIPPGCVLNMVVVACCPRARAASLGARRPWPGPPSERRGSELPELTAVSVDGSPLATGDDSVAKSPSCLGCGRTERRDSLTMIPSCLKSRRASVEDSGIRPPRVRKTGSMPVGLTSPEKDSCASPAGLPCLRRAKTISGDEQERGLRRKPRGSRVCFPSCFLSSTHDVTPYAEKYGVHPRFFEFDRQGNKRLTDSGIMEDIRRAEKCLSPLKLSRQLGPLTQVCKH
ncbi:unnamed protein product, partial [Prorocentrum cordatum]